MLLYVFTRDGVASVLVGRRGLDGVGRRVEEDGTRCFREEQETLEDEEGRERWEKGQNWVEEMMEYGPR